MVLLANRFENDNNIVILLVSHANFNRIISYLLRKMNSCSFFKSFLLLAYFQEPLSKSLAKQEDKSGQKGIYNSSR